ncbi:uncharacterized protein I303_100220 [Kwoniella dejecticola CBS 10117]|uniref:Uncharacterized protein n=1 Tax=Kwoniella dejecticola CBS 10117 TaxID=1296121 RepID=A0AAJ8KHN5_9TREE
MGYTLQLHWSYTPPPGRQISLADIVLPRVLESYSLHTPSRSTVQFRTYRSSFPSSSTDPSNTNRTSRYLTTINTLPNPLPPGQNQSTLNSNSNKSAGNGNGRSETNEDDITYLFLDDRSVISGNILQATQKIVKNQSQAQSQSQNQGQNQSNTSSNPTPTPNTLKPDLHSTQTPRSQNQPIEIDKDTLDDDGFEIIDIPASDSTPIPIPQTQTNNAPPNASADAAAKTPAEERRTRTRKPTRFKCLIVKPTSNVQPLLQSLLSPFVMGYTKSAKATASTTSSSLPTPTPLPGSSLLLTVLTFNALPFPVSAFQPNSNPEYTLRLKVFILPNPNATSIFLEVEYQPLTPSPSRDTNTGIDTSEPEPNVNKNVKPIEICQEFLEGCLISGLNGTLKWIHLDQDQDHDQEQSVRSFKRQSEWEGIERFKKSVFALTRAMRESGFL